MHVQTTVYQPARGWLAPLPAPLDGPHTLVLVFGARDLTDLGPPVDQLLSAFPRSVVLGCSTAGEIAADQVADAGLSVAVARFEHTRLQLAQAEVAGPEASAAAGAALARQLRAGGEDLRAVLVLSDGMGVNGTTLVRALTDGLPAGTSVTGGLAGDGARFERTWVLAQGRVAAGRVAAVGLYGQRLQVGAASQGGWMDFGPERQITRSQGHVLFELDGKPALDLYKDYLGDMAAGLPGTALRFPISVWHRDAPDRAVVRTILAVDEAAKSLTFAGDMPQGHSARLKRTTTDSLVDSAALAAGRAAQNADWSGGAASGLAISVSCVGRRLVLGERTEEELESVLGQLPPGTAHVGFYSYGEIAPSAVGGASELHNQTMTVTVFTEA